MYVVVKDNFGFVWEITNYINSNNIWIYKIINLILDLTFDNN